MAQVRYVIGQNHPLSRYHTFPAIEFSTYSATSVEMMHGAIQLFQNHNPSSARILLRRLPLRHNPSNITTWVARRLGDNRSAASIIAAPSLYYYIMVHLLQRGGNPFHAEFVRLSNMHPTERVKFFAPGTDSPEGLLWSCGLRANAINNSTSEHPFPGFNAYGEKLDKAFYHFRGGAFDFHIPVGILMTENQVPTTTYSKTVLVLSDSQSRQIAAIDGGTVISISGGQYHHLAENVRCRNISLRDYGIIIVICGVNVARRSASRRGWERSWEPLRRELDVLRDYPDSKVIMVSAIGVPKARRCDVVEHTEWAEQEFNHRYPEENFHFVNLASPGPGNVFLNPNGSVRPRFFKPDELHVNHAGWRQMYRCCIFKVPQLRKVAYTVSRGIYPNQA